MLGDMKPFRLAGNIYFVGTYKASSHLIDTGDGLILIDTGYEETADVIVESVGALGFDIRDIKYILHSHGHYDHAGGFGAFLGKYPDKRIYAMEAATGEYYSASGGSLHEIGIPKGVYPAYKENFGFFTEATKLGEGIHLIPHSTEGLERMGERSGLYKKVGDEMFPDDFIHEASLVFDTDRGLVIFNSCSHGGLLNILKEVESFLPGRKLYAFLGGLHMKGTRSGEEICTFSETEIEQLAEGVKASGLERIYTGHCTGSCGYEQLKKYLPEVVYALRTGDTFTI